VLATARSYSSVITTMVGQHPALVGLPELKLFCCRTIGELEATLPRFWIERGVTHRSPGLVRALAQFEYGDQTLRSLARARAWLEDRRHWTGADVLDVLLARVRPRVAVEKSPDDVLTDAGLERMASTYPEARYLHLTRHPVTTQRSVEEHRRRTVGGHPLPGEPMSGVASWYETHRRILHFAARLPAGRYLRVRAEDVLNDRASRLRAIAGWLGLADDDAAIEAMQHPEASPFACFGPAESGVSGGNDPDFLRDPIPHPVRSPGALEPPASWDADPSDWALVVAMATRLGYAPDETDVARRSEATASRRHRRAQ
jgi:hypothetical protein